MKLKIVKGPFTLLKGIKLFSNQTCSLYTALLPWPFRSHSHYTWLISMHAWINPSLFNYMINSLHALLQCRHGKTVVSGRVGSGHWSKRVNRVVGKMGRGLQVGSSWPVFFFFFFEVDAICQLFMSSLTIIRFSLVILLSITTKHLTWYPNLVQLLFQLSRS